MNSMDVFESIGDIKPSNALDYLVTKPYWEQLRKGTEWHLGARRNKFANEDQREAAIDKRIRHQIANVAEIKWQNYQIKSTFNYKLVPPIMPARTRDIDHLKSLLKQYLCTNCCSHRVIRTPRTAPGCVDVMETYQGLRSEDVVVPPKTSHEKYF